MARAVSKLRRGLPICQLRGAPGETSWVYHVARVLLAPPNRDGAGPLQDSHIHRFRNPQ
ncbi:hypothetical protein EMIT0P176_300042 [Pseudomonas sp. IT-P176]